MNEDISLQSSLTSSEKEESIELKNILDIEALNALMENFHSITGIGIAVLDLKGEVLVGVGWQDICTKFHRVNSLTLRNCIESDTVLTRDVKPGEYLSYKCMNNLQDIVTPIFVSGQHVGNLFLGQFIYDDEALEYEVFLEQAGRYGFDKEAYIKALESVPRWSRKKVKKIMDLYSRFASIISLLLTNNLALEKALKVNKKIIEDLKATEERYKLISENTGDVIWILDLESMMLSYISPSVEKLRGYTQQEALKQSLSEAFTAESMRFIMEYLPLRIKELNKGNESFRILTKEVSQPHKDGRIIPTEMVTTLITDETGKVTSILGLSRDISQRKKDEEIREKLIDELNKSNTELEQFAYVASHDLKEPLRMITNYMQLLTRNYSGKLDERADAYISYAVDGAMRMNALINDLLVYSRVSSKARELTPVDLNAVVEEVIRDLQLSIEENKALINCGSLPAVMADSLQMRQLFQNLIQNAIKFRDKPNPQIEISAVRVEKQWLIKVQDNGIGIDPQFSDKIFVIFQRLNERDKYAGTGIGLAICKKIVESHGGRIWVESGPGKGSSFYFTLPD
ncbi:MAG: PocR ligand-binding domain-containing protein [archaeon]